MSTYEPQYDLVIVGAGPAGLALAQVCSSTKKVLVIEKEADIGGCHRVRRSKENLFTEHGPRVYTGAYVNFKGLLKDIGVEFHDIFTPYRFNFTRIGNETIWKTLSGRELLVLIKDFLQLLAYSDHGKDVTMEEYVKLNRFSDKTRDVIDRLCRLTDGAGSDRFTLHEFLSLFNYHFMYGIYQPKAPNDKLLFPLWKKELEKKGVVFLTNTRVTGISTSGKLVTSISVTQNSSKTVLRANDFVLSFPPKQLHQLIQNSTVKDAFGPIDELRRYAVDTEYIDYLSITFHWDTDLILQKVYGFPRSEWGIGFVVLTDYMKFDEESSKTVISLAITYTDTKSTRINKTANECDEKQLLDEALAQLKETFPDLPQPTHTLLSPGVVRDTLKNKWTSLDTAYISTAKEKKFLDFKSKDFSNLFTLGTHNGKSLYPFTTLESAVSNAIVLGNILNGNKNDRILQKSFTFANLMLYIVITLVIISITLTL